MKKRYWFLCGFVLCGLIGAASADDKQPIITTRPDLSKPLRTRIGAPICLSRAELKVLIAGGESDDCIHASKEIAVSVSELPETFSDIMRVRVRNKSGQLVDYWTLRNALQN